MHAFKRDPSLRCFHVNLDQLQPAKLHQLHLRLIASSGTHLVEYHGAGSERMNRDGETVNGQSKWDARINLGKYLGVRTLTHSYRTHDVH